MGEPPVAFDSYDEEVAAAFLDSSLTRSGLPGFLGIRTVESSPGRMVAAIEAREDLFNPFGSLHGGVIAAFVDHLLGAVLYPVIERGRWAATAEFKVNYLSPVREGTVHGEALILSKSSRTAVVRVEVTNRDRLVAAAQGTVILATSRT